MLRIKPKTLYITLSLLMVGLVALEYGVLLVHERLRSDALMLQQAGAAAKRIGREAAGVVEAELRPARVSVAMLAAGASDRSGTEAGRLSALPQMVAVLRSNASVSAVYLATARGSFLLLRRLPDEAARSRLQAPGAAAFALQSVDRDAALARGVFSYFDASMRPLGQQERADYDFDPRSRPWYEQATKAGDGVAVQSAPYRFFTTAEAGLTLAQRHGTTVIGADVSLHALDELLTRPQISRSAELLIATAGGEVVAQSRRPLRTAASGDKGLLRVADVALPLREFWSRRDAQGQLAPVQDLQGREWVTHALPLSAAAGSDAPLTLLMASPRDELQAFQIESRRHGLFLSLALILLLLPLVHWLADRVSRPLRHLARQAEAIRHFEFDGPDPGRSLIREVDHLGLAMTAMKHSLRRFLDISGALSAERDFDTLVDRILRETVAVANANAGALHLLSASRRQLQPAASLVDGESMLGVGLTWDIDAADSIAAPVQALRGNAPVELELRWDEPAHLAAYETLFTRLGAARLRLLSLPLHNRQDELIGTLTLSFAVPAEGPAEPLGAARVSFVQALSGVAALAIDNHLLLRARKRLLESFIQLVAGAIDAKSPYTGGHCQRVPALAKLLATAACEATSGPFADFNLDADGWEALHIASWLHDCGKVTTPEYVVDKATKLETLNNRIHEIRTRFEVLKRDASIARLEAALGPERAAAIRAELVAAHAQLDEEFAFVAQCNQGGEHLGPQAVERLHQIGQRRWMRSLDDSIGLSYAESRRLPLPRPPLPATEPLLADRPEHIVPRTALDHMPEDNRWGFKLDEPEHLYHHGELYNLSISRGTLNAEERYKINDHIVQTIKMLAELPFPEHLRQVPEIAGGHHERMDGKGYPLRLTREQMSVPARIMAIADVFEALTADDRPYKKGKLLSEALDLMARMSREGHIDSELFELFLRSGACLRYAQEHMAADQIDLSDPERYLA